MGEEGDEEGMGEVTAETVLQQRPAGAIALPDFDLMKFSTEWSEVESEEADDHSDLDTYTFTQQTNIPITESKTLDQYGVGYIGDKSMSQISVSSSNPLIVRKDYTKVYTSDYSEVTEETIEEYNLNYTDSEGNPQPKPADQGKDIYKFYQYLAWSGDNIGVGGEYTVVNFKKILNETVRSGQKAIFLYIKASWYAYNGDGQFNIKYNIYKLNNEEKGLISPKSEYNFTPEDSSVEELSVTSNLLENIHQDKKGRNVYGDPSVTLYYDLSTKEITFIQGYYTEEDIYGKGSSSDTFIWTDATED